MTVSYDNIYEDENFFGEPYPELIEFFAGYPEKGQVLDLGCGQGRNAIALARLGYAVTGIDISEVGIGQMNQAGKAESLNLDGEVGDMYRFEEFDQYDFILLDSIFHFTKKEKEKEVRLVQKIVSRAEPGCLIVICIQDTRNKVKILNQAIDFDGKLNRHADRKFKYVFEDDDSGHMSESDCRMVIAEK